jgi:hypothetical protein
LLDLRIDLGLELAVHDRRVSARERERLDAIPARGKRLEVP